MKTKPERTQRTSSRSYTLGRKAFARISAVEGVRISAAMDADFRSFDKEHLSSKKRRQILVEKYGKAR